MFYLLGDFDLVIRTNILEVRVAKYDDLPFCCKQRKFIQALLRQLDSAGLCAKIMAQIVCVRKLGLAGSALSPGSLCLIRNSFSRYEDSRVNLLKIGRGAFFWRHRSKGNSTDERFPVR